MRQGQLMARNDAYPGRNLPRSMMNWIICRRVTHSFHQMRMPRALWK